MSETYLNTSVVGGAPALIEHFSIEGLHGYRNVSLTSKFAATILIAQNGSGKTTLLGALDVFLKGQFARFGGLEFTRINCKLATHPTTLTLTQEDVLSFIKIGDASELIKFSASYGIDALQMLHFLDGEFQQLTEGTREYHEHPIVEAVISKMGFSTTRFNEHCNRLIKFLAARNANIERIKTILSRCLQGYEIVYLPTYRRIELSLGAEPDEERTGRRKKSIQTKLGITQRGIFNTDIQFGLADVLDRLARLNQNILFTSNEGYREISANIINEMLSGGYEETNIQWENIPSKESLSLFFSRIKDSAKRMGPYRDMAIPDIDRIYTNQALPSLPYESAKFLNYFLTKLNTVITATRETELMVEAFVQRCNNYLSEADTSVQVFEEDAADYPLDVKFLVLDHKSLSVDVVSLLSGKEIPLDALSSGEKQMISLFARLYLYPKKKIVLIDEPEISLSIDWQRKILLDIVHAPSCAQVVAITHSPFIFDNDLEPFAQPLGLRVRGVDGSIRRKIQQ